MTGIPLALAVTAGMLAAVNPCGFALLPAYLGLFVGGSPDREAGAGGTDSRLPALRRAAVATAAMTGGFVLVFGTFGLVVSPLALSVERQLPVITVVIGMVLMGLGVWLLSGRTLRLPLPGRRGGGRNPTESARGMALFGVSYALASLSCTIAPFLAITTTAFRAGSVTGVVAVFLGYAAGMGIVVGALTLAAALSRRSLAVRLRSLLPRVHRIAGLLMLPAGAYVTYYGWYEVRALRGDLDGADPVISFAVGIQGEVTRWLNDLGPWPPVVAILALLALTAGTELLRRRARRGGAQGPAETVGPAAGALRAVPRRSAHGAESGNP
ncbi:cytochrome c biogenesis CcdA family protein [Streptomyces calidiresistens]|uniref:Cytochrome c biogenesis protein CcdA n=1 Tax=Streptomyces calidiresistens TaxID=1485586 RepID=A0A7W3T535_9ACTN|nr:cytochrome c biogenesis protein CcdA [Streptomyces calidiresistens]MBB0231089.1 cytochrome c biogenesis protein CcdA [Streptomyces calidiresistens]